MDSERREKLEELLETIETAIKSLVENKVASYRIGERYFTYHSIDELQRMRRDILRELNETPFTIIATPFDEGLT